MVKREITSMHVRYVDATDGPRSESFDPEEFKEVYTDFNVIINEYVNAGAKNIVIEIETGEAE